MAWPTPSSRTALSTSHPYPPHRIGAGIALKLGAVIAMGAMAALVKLAADQGAHTLEIVFFRSLFAFIPIVAYILATRGLRVLRTSRPLGHLVRATIGITGMLCGFSALSMMPLSEFTAITFAAPLFITALSWPVLGERVGPYRWAAVVVGFAGVLVMIRPDPSAFIGLGAILALGQALGTAGAMLAIRQLGATEPGPTIVFYFTLAGTLVGAAGLPFVWTDPTPTLLLILVACGLCGGVGQLLLTQAFRLAPAAIIAPFEYAALIWAGLIGFAIWRETPAPTTILGGCIVAASGLYILWRETRRRKSGG
jgi:drug/metabolite transporter (DMT)-like permease